MKGEKVNLAKRATALVALALVASSVSAVEVDGVAAKVGAETILRSDVAGEMMRQGIRDASRYKEVRDEMIERKLILKAAREAKMTMQEWIVENRVREIVQKAFDGDRNKLIKTLAQQRISYPEWYARMKEDMIVGAMRWNVINKNITASPAEMSREYAAHPERYVAEHRVTVSVIMLTPEERVRRDEISASLKDKSFDDLGAKKYADVKPEDVFKPAVCAEIAAMPKGTISKWIDIDGWSFLIRKDAETAGRNLSFEEAFDEIEANVKEEKSKAAFKAWMSRLREETYVKVF
jgi:parvulin-like peptidyl-prolyl isomerase